MCLNLILIKAFQHDVPYYPITCSEFVPPYRCFYNCCLKKIIIVTSKHFKLE